MVRKRRKKSGKSLSPITMILLLIGIVILISTILSLLGVEGNVTSINGGGLEASLVTLNNLLTPKGLRYFIGNVLVNFSTFEPFFYLIVSLIGIGIAEKSGLFEILLKPFKKMKPTIVTFILLLISIFSGIMGEAGFALLLPFSAVLYKYLNRNPMMGILTSFLGLSMGYGTNFIYNNTDIVLGTLMESAAKVDVDKNFEFSLISNLYIMISSSLLLTFIGTIIIEKFLASKFSRRNKSETLELEGSKKALFFTNITFLLLVGFVIYGLIPGLPCSGLFLDTNANIYVEKVWGETAPFHQGIVYIISLILSICSLVYGYVSGNIKNNSEYVEGLAYELKDLGYLFVLMFLGSQLIGILEWTNLGKVLAGRCIEFLSLLEFSGLPLILFFFIITIFIGILIPSTEVKWNLMAPLIIPLFMRSNIAPEFTLFIFKAADGIAKCITPVSGGLLITLGLLQKYNQEESKISFFGTLNKMKSSILLFSVLWVLILVGWYLVGLPLGSSVYPTL